MMEVEQGYQKSQPIDRCAVQPYQVRIYWPSGSFVTFNLHHLYRNLRICSELSIGLYLVSTQTDLHRAPGKDKGRLAFKF